ncbi:hypothetical protein POUND7_015547 [Theobroma cacao]
MSDTFQSIWPVSYPIVMTTQMKSSLINLKLESDAYIWVVFVHSYESGSKPMAVVSILFVFLLSRLLLLHLAEAENRLRPDCPAFDCGNFGNISFPFTKSERPECGLCLVDGCNKTVAKIQLEKGGRWYQLKQINQGNTVTVYDQELGKQLQSKDCEALSMWSLPNHPLISFHFFPNLTLLKCNATLFTSFPEEINQTRCNDYNLYYPVEDEPSRSWLLYCSISQLPVTMSQQGNDSQSDKYLFKLVTAEFSVELRVVKDCGDCHYKGGQCLVNDKQEFYCGNENKSNLGLKLGLGIGSLFLLTLIIFSIYLRRHLLKQNEQFSHIQL